MKTAIKSGENMNVTKGKKIYSKIKIVIAIICIVVIIAMIIILVNSYVKMSSIRVIDVNFSISDYIGFNLDQESLNFGTTVPGGTATRVLELVSDRPVKVHIVVNGEVEKWIYVSENDFILDGKKEVGFAIKAPDETPMGNYTGKVTIFFMKP